jgi:hypothetical protein
MQKVRRRAVIVGGGVGIFAATATITSLVLNAQPSLFRNLSLPGVTQSGQTICKTLATDPNPPLNVRSSPVVAPDNVVGKLRNGTQLIVVDENEGWLRITSPLEGWVYKELTVTSCVSATALKNQQSHSGDTGANTLAEAREFYHAGNLKAAISLAQTVTPNSAAYQNAQTAMLQWQKDWTTAEAEFYSAQKAYRERRWQDVVQKVRGYPDNRFWKSKLTPLVQEAMKQQNQ